jgi:hypothetical protein
MGDDAVNDRQKDEKVRQMNTEALRRILGNLQSPEDRTPSPDYPLGGMVHLSGIGQVRVSKLRAELDRREAAA